MAALTVSAIHKARRHRGSLKVPALSDRQLVQAIIVTSIEST
jgi:hypothetical protein